MDRDNDYNKKDNSMEDDIIKDNIIKDDNNYDSDLYDSIMKDNTENIIKMMKDIDESEQKEIIPSEKQGFLKKSMKSLKNSWNRYIDISGNNFIIPMIFMIGVIIYLEVVLHLLNYRSVDSKILFPILFAIPLGLLISFITGLFTEKVNKMLLILITTFICIIFNTQLVYFYVFKVYFSFQSLAIAGDAVTNFGAEILAAMKANVVGIILLFLPLIILVFIMGNFIDYARRGIKEQIIFIGSSAIFQIIAMTALLFFGKNDYTPYDLYFNSNVPDMCAKQLGIATMTRIDVTKLLFHNDDLVLANTLSLDTDPIATVTKTPTPEPTGTVVANVSPGVTQPPTPTPIDTSPNVMDIDFNALAANEKDDTFKTLDQYFATVTPTNKNKYTGMFKGYNLIQLTAEGFSPYAVNKDVTPTLYKMVHECFVFNNFYTALWQTSTSDGEYVAMLGQIPDGTRSMYKGRNNLWPFALGKQFDLLGVASKAYHAHTYTYYQRDQTHPNLGYIYKGNGNGLVLDHPNSWPESDLEMINHTVDEYINEDQFHVYYMTVSGHMNYTFIGNSMSYKNRALVADLPYSDDVKAYIACQIELDKALEQLIKKLEEAGVADHTVIALSADHYPYGWEKSKLDEIAGHVVDPNFEVYRNNFILWSEGMKEKVVIDEPCSSMDIIPTLSNLFGLQYDSRLLMGRDMLSDTPPLVFLSNHSFITDKVMYNSETGEVTKLTDEVLPDNYISNLNKIVKNKFTVSKTILEKDYYRHIFPDYPDLWNK